MDGWKLYKEIYRDYIYSQGVFGSDTMLKRWMNSLPNSDLELLADDDIGQLCPDEVVELAQHILAERLLCSGLTSTQG
jgi:hypothetical protein